MDSNVDMFARLEVLPARGEADTEVNALEEYGKEALTEAE